MNLSARPRPWLGLLLGLLVGFVLVPQPRAAGVFDVKDYGATGKKADDARPALQRAIEACASAGGGLVRLPPGDYTSGTLRLRSHVHLELAAGATLYASPDPAAYDFGAVASKAALLYGEDLEDVRLSGHGTVDGQAEYEWRLDDFERAFDHKTLMQSLGKPLWRPFPKGFPKRNVLPHLLWLGRAKDVRVTGLSFVRSASWTIACYGCERLVFDHLRIQSSLREAVWADGIDLDGCKEVRIADCVIETGDDCIVFISADSWGPALACENIIVTNCRLSSASAGLKFSEGNKVGVHDVLVRDTVLTNVNRGVVFATTLGGFIRDVVLTDLTLDCNRFPWFWAGDGQPFHFRVTRASELNQEPPQPGEPVPGLIRNVLIRNVRARAKGTSLIQGHPERWLEDIRLENVHLALSADPAAPFERADHAVRFRWATNLVLTNLTVSWQTPAYAGWKSSLYFEEVRRLDLDGFTGRGAWLEREEPAVVLNNVVDALVHNSRSPDSNPVFLKAMGRATRGLRLEDNDFRQVRSPVQASTEVPVGAVTTRQNRLHE